MQATGAGEHRLRRAEPRRQPVDDVATEFRARGQLLDALDLDRVERGLAADAAAGRRVEVPLQRAEVEFDVLGEVDADDVGRRAARRQRPAERDPADLAAVLQDALGEKKPGRQFEIGAGSPHRDRQAPAFAPAVRPEVDADLHRLLDGQDVVLLDPGPSGADLTDLDGSLVFVAGMHRAEDSTPLTTGPAPRRLLVPTNNHF